MSKVIALLLLLAAALAVTPRAHALPPTLGTLTIQGNDPYPCSGARNGIDFYAGMNCFNATVSCPNTADIGLTFGWTGPASPQGTVVFFSGGKGTAPSESGDDIPVYAAAYVNQFEIVYLEWNTSWEDPSSDGSGGNILDAACRPATFLNYINTSGIHLGAMCAQGGSAGSAAIAYSMSWYGAGSYLKDVQLVSGPVLSEMDQGCTYPNASTPTLCGPGTTYCSPKTVAWSDNIIYVPGDNSAVSSWSGLPACATSSVNSANYPLWAAMSIVDGTSVATTPTFSFAAIPMHGWLCQSYAVGDCTGSSCPNNSASEGKYFYDAVSAAEGVNSNLTVTGVTSCTGPEGVAGGTDPDSGNKASIAIYNKMKTECALP